MTELRLHGFLASSRTNGPGRRAVVWVQGCTLGCAGCFNPQSHAPTGGTVTSVADLVERIVARAQRLDGVTISGGEPFQQAPAVLELLQAVRERTSLSTLVFTGFTWDELDRHGLTNALSRTADLVVAGRYVESERKASGLLGSANQRIVELSGRIRAAELETLPDAEVVIRADGEIVLTGIDPVRTGSFASAAPANGSVR